MKTPSSLPIPGARLAGALVLLFVAACGNSEPTAATAPQPSESPSAAPAAPASAEPEAAPTASASASAKAEAKPPRSQGGGRPAVLKSDASEISDTFGSSPASKLELGDKDIATLRLPEEALHQATLVTFKIERSGKSGGGQVGKVYSIKSVYPPAAEPEQIASNGPPFLLELPAGNKKEVNLAIGVEDDKGKLKWTIVAPKNVDDSRHVAVFELATLPSGFLHLTTKAAK